MIELSCIMLDTESLEFTRIFKNQTHVRLTYTFIGYIRYIKLLFKSSLCNIQ